MVSPADRRWVMILPSPSSRSTASMPWVTWIISLPSDAKNPPSCEPGSTTYSAALKGSSRPVSWRRKAVWGASVMS